MHPTQYTFASAAPDNIKQWKFPDGKFHQKLSMVKRVGVVIWYLSIPLHDNSRAVVKNLGILVCRSILRLTITHLKLKIVTSHHQVLSQF